MSNRFGQLYKKKKVMITGGLGFIGSNLARRLVELGAEVLLVDSMIPQFGGNLYNINGIEKDVSVNISDVRDENSLKYLLVGQDYLFNLAGTLSHIDSMTDPYTDLEINCKAQLSILEACRKSNPNIKVIFSGTRGQYGRCKYFPVDEEHPLNPIDVNGINNIAGELYHLLYFRSYNIRAVSLRMTNVYGPRHLMKHSRQGFLNWFIRLAMSGEPIKVFGDGRQLRDFNFVDDVVDALLMVAADENSNGEVYNLGSGEAISVANVARLVVELAGSGSVEFVPYPEDKKVVEVGDYQADITKIKNKIGWFPKTEIADGLLKTVCYYKTNRQFYW